MTTEDLFRSIYRIRRVEEEIIRVYPTDKIQSPVHLSIGQELASVAVCAALAPGDKVFGTYRSHALYLAKGGDLNAFVAELYGKQTGCANGKGGSMHLVEEKAGLLGTSAIVASLIPVAVGYAFAQKRQKTGVVTVCFFGDGATEEGCYFEALNFAALHALPILFVCENNGHAIHTPLEARQSTKIAERAQAFGLNEAQVVRGFHETVSVAARMVRELRSGQCRPAFLESRADRYHEHVGPGEDWKVGYRRRDTTIPDPLAEAAADVDVETQAKIRAEVDAEIAGAFAFAEASPEPGADELMRDTYAAE